jgi:DeoR family glycerol-3-phosphate regulon repressor
VALELYRNPAVEVILAGGLIRRSDGGIIGPGTAEHIREFRVDTAVVGTSAIDADGTLLDFDIREVQVSQAIIASARRVMLVTDSSKFNRSAPVRIGHLSDIDVLVTDRLPSPEIAALCAEHGVEVVETSGTESEEP